MSKLYSVKFRDCFLLRLKITLLVFLIFNVVFSYAAEELPFAAECLGDHVNIRAGRGMNYEVIAQLEKSEKVVVAAKEDDWYKIELPISALVYVNRQYIQRESGRGIVKSDHVNIRTGPNLNYTVLTQVNSNDRLNIISEENDWYAVEPTKSCFGWVKSDLLKFNSNYKDYIERLAYEQNLKQQLIELEALYKQEVLKNPLDMNLKTILLRYQDILGKNLDTKFGYTASRMIDKIKLQISENERLKLLKLMNERQEPPMPDEPPITTGTIDDLGMIYKRPGTHKLIYHGKIIYYLRSSTVDLNTYIYQKVQIWGDISNLSHLDKPLITVSYIRLKKD